MRTTLCCVLLAGLLSSCAAPRYPIDAALSCECAPTGQRAQQIIAIAAKSGFVRNPAREGPWPGSGSGESTRVTLAHFDLESSSDIELVVTDQGSKLVAYFKIKRYYSNVTDAENEILLDLERQLALQQPGIWTERRFDFKAGNYIDRPL